MDYITILTTTSQSFLSLLSLLSTVAITKTTDNDERREANGDNHGDIGNPNRLETDRNETLRFSFVWSSSLLARSIRSRSEQPPPQPDLQPLCFQLRHL